MANSKDFIVKNGIQAGANSSITGTLAVGNTSITGTLSTTGNTAVTGNLMVNTVTAGTWNGSVIAGQYGGTGVNNSGKTITLGGNITTANSLTTSGNFATTLTATAATNVTLPTTGTLATLAGTETLTNKTLTSPTMTTPTLGVASATSINKVTITAPTTGSTLTIADGKTATISNTLTFTGTDSSSVAFGTGGTVAYTANKLSAFAATTSAELAGIISDETGSGNLVFSSSASLSSPTFTGNTTFDTDTLFVDATNNRVGVGTITPSSPFHIAATGLGDLVDTLRISHTNPGATFGPALLIQRDSSTPANNDAMGYIAFRGNNSAGNASDYAWIQSYIIDTTATTEDGALALAVKRNGAYTEIVNVSNTGIDVTGNVIASGSMSISTGQITSGTYTPTLTGVTNIASSSAFLCNYMRVGDIVTVSGGIAANVTTGNTNSEIGISLPIASAFTAFQHCGGVGSPTNATYSAENGSIYGDGTNDRATMSFKPSATGTRNYAIHFTYRII